MENSVLLNIKNAVHKVYTAGGTGTAFYLNEHDCFATNYHVVQGCHEVALENQSKYRYNAKVILIDPVNDIAILRCADAPKTASIKLNTTLQANDAEKVTVLGFPYGPFSVTEGIISNNARILNNKTFIQTDAAINPGNSGGPIVTNNGELIAIASSKLVEANSTGFGIPYFVLVSVLNKLTDSADQVFSIACESCGNLLIQEAAYCPSCGASINTNYFKQREAERFAPVIEQAISDAGIHPVLARSGKLFWEFYNGSSLIRIFSYKESYVYATSPLNSLGGNKLEQLYRYLASNASAPYRFGIYQNDIYLSYRFAVADIYGPNKTKILAQLSGFIAHSDDTDNYIEDNFGCPKSVFSRS
ncbi:MAG: trypsin-like peptidase domain-containing protein [Ferruginibacter sp.]